MNRVNEFSPSLSSAVSHPGYRDGNRVPSPRQGQFGWDHRSAFHDNARIGAPVSEYRPIEERAAMRPFGETSVPTEPYPTRIIIVNNMGYGRNPRLPRFPHLLTPRPVGQGNMQIPTETDDSRLTKEEQDSVLKKLKKQIYNPMPKMLARRVSLYYRELNHDHNAKATDKHKDEEGKRCAVCLEDFEPREEVMLTPCNHMFHEACIVPWVKNHGKCPVCRSAFYERIRENGSTSNNNRRAVLPPQHGLFADELLSLIQAVDEAFIWGA